MTTIASLPLIEQYSEEGKSLERSRVELLTLIDLLQGAGEVDFKTIRAKKNQYNSIIDSIDKLKAKHRMDPIDKLPPELFARIIYQAAFDGAIESPIFGPEYPIVSLRWMKFIIDTPIYWRFIALNQWRSDSFPNLLTCLELSRQLPLSVSISYTSGLERSPAWQELLKHRHRIVQINYLDRHHTMRVIDTNNFDTTFRNCMRSLSPLPALESLHSEHTFDNLITQHVLDMYPTLRDDPESLWPLLESNPFLKDVGCYGGINGENMSSIFATKPLSWERLCASPLTLQLSIVITQNISGLVFLSVSGHLITLVRLLTSIDRLSRLEELYLRLLIDFPAIPEGDLPTSFPSNNAIKTFILHLSPGSTRLLYSDDAQEGSAALPKFKSFTSLVIHSLPSIRTLGMTVDYLPKPTSIGEIFDMGAVQRLSSLRCIRISSYLVIDLSELPPCEILGVYCASVHSVIPFLNEKARHLSISCNKREDHKVHQALTEESWPCIEKLTIPIYLISKNLSGFPNLREIELRSLNYEGNITKFCHHLALYPDLCPALEVLSIEECPEWDIFFIMLERRILLSANGRTAFKSITLPGYTPRNLLRHICEILQGRLPDRPSNFDLSLLSKADLLLDKTICSFTSPSDMKRYPEKGKTQWLDSIPQYPHNEDEILSSWENRLNTWKEGVLLAQFRRERCVVYSQIQLDQLSSLGGSYVGF
ncbi:hypothetical protein CPB86DRAFT_793289 [Serendipita vermifera]|nr:hypothetical protein CPB86DRAFT_793289 [Serendipita vermifera]